MEVTKLLIDGDILVYRAGYACENEPKSHCLHTVDMIITKILTRYPETPYTIYLSGPSVNNYRHNYAVTAPYKGNRDKPKPKWYDAIREYLMEEYDTVMTDNNEADDAIAIDYTELFEDWYNYSTNILSLPCIVSIDKDFDQIHGIRYDFVKETEVFNDELTALRNLWSQCVQGDSVDNIIGIKGVGPVKAKKAFENLSDTVKMYRRAVAMFVVKGGYSLSEAKQRVEENMTLVYLQRHDGELWRTKTHVYG